MHEILIDMQNMLSQNIDKKNFINQNSKFQLKLMFINIKKNFL